VINNKSQGNVAAHLRCGGLFSYHFVMYLKIAKFSHKKNKIGEHITKLQAKRLTVSCALFALQCSA